MSSEWLACPTRAGLLKTASTGQYAPRRHAIAKIRNEFTLQSNAHGMSNLIAMWRDPETHTMIRVSMFPTCHPTVQKEAIMLLRHLTFHQDVLLELWRDAEMRRLLLNAASADQTFMVRIEALAVLHNLTFAESNQRGMWEDETTRRVMLSSAALDQPLPVRREAIATLANLTMCEHNLPTMRQHDELGVIFASCAHVTHKDVRADALTALGKLKTAPSLLKLHAPPAAVARPSPASRSPSSAFQSAAPSAAPSAVPSTLPSTLPSAIPSAIPSTLPSALPSAIPSAPLATLPSTLHALDAAAASSHPLPPPPSVTSSCGSPSELPVAHTSIDELPRLANSSADDTARPSDTPSFAPSRAPSRARDGDLLNNPVNSAAAASSTAANATSTSTAVTVTPRESSAHRVAFACAGPSQAMPSPREPSTPRPSPYSSTPCAASAFSSAARLTPAVSPEPADLTSAELELVGDVMELLPADDEAEELSVLVARAAMRTLCSLLLRTRGRESSKLFEGLLEHANAAMANTGSALQERWASLTSVIVNKLKASAALLPTAFWYDERCMGHLQSVASDDPNIFDKPQRIQRAIDAARAVQRASLKATLKLTLCDLSDDVVDKKALYDLVRLAHTDKYLKRQLRVLDEAEDESVGPGSVMSAGHDECNDTLVTHGTLQAVLSAIHVVKSGVDGVLGNRFANGFCCVRPPGHHVGRDGRTEDAPTQGFCFFNNVAIAAKYAVDSCGLQRVAVIDFDVHHGNGTEEILGSDSRFLFISSHTRGQAFYPGTGAESWKNVLNVPLSLGFSADDFLREWSEAGVPGRIAAFQPQLIILSAGFDAHRDDPALGGRLETEDFLRLTEHMVSLAWGIESCHGRLLSVLEGGYDTSVPTPHRQRGGALQRSVEAHLKGLVSSSRLPSNFTSSVLGKRKKPQCGSIASV